MRTSDLRSLAINCCRPHHRGISSKFVEASSPKILYYIDEPPSWAAFSPCLILRGWCFSTTDERLSGVRLRVGDNCLNGVIGLPRPDVQASLPSAPDDNTGFEIRGLLPAGTVQVFLEAQLGNSPWQLLSAPTVRVKRQWMPLWLGNGTWTELMFTQMSGYRRHSPRKLKADKFPQNKSPNSRPLKLSVVTPSFQQAHYLPDTLSSVLYQTHITCEYVVQDGGSTDGSVEIIRQHANSTHTSSLTNTQEVQHTAPSSKFSGRNISTKLNELTSTVQLIHWESIHDDGQADAIARGFLKTTGSPDDLMAWINSDDFYVPGALAFVVDYFSRHPEVDAVYGHRILVDENSQEIGRWFLPKHDDEVLRLNDFVPQETLFWRRRIWDKVGGIDTSFKFAMDWDLLLRFQAAGARIVRLPYFLACFRIHSAQKTSAAMHSTGQKEIDRLRKRTHGRTFRPVDLEENPRLLRYLRRSAWIEFLWKWGIRAR